jgi:hypothetical protein
VGRGRILLSVGGAAPEDGAWADVVWGNHAALIVGSAVTATTAKVKNAAIAAAMVAHAAILAAFAAFWAMAICLMARASSR